MSDHDRTNGCDTCGQPHPRCYAHNGRGTPCGVNPVNGMRVCGSHGARAPQSKAAAARRTDIAKVEADARALLAHHGIRGITDPLEELARGASEVIAFKDALAARVNALNEVRYTDDKGGEQLRAEIVLYERALDRTRAFLEVLIKTGFQERLTRLDEERGALVAQVVRAILDRLDLTPTQQTLVGTVVPEEFRRLTLTSQEPA